MKKICLSIPGILAVVVLHGQANNFRDPSIDVQHYGFRVTLTDSDDHIQGDARIKVKFLKPAAFLAFDLVQKNAAGKGMLVSTVRDSIQELHFEQINNILRIDLANPISTGEIHEYEIIYSGIPQDGMIISKNKFGNRTFFADNWPNRAHNWIPCNDHPSDKAPVDFVVFAPSHYQVVGNGVLEEQTNIGDGITLTHWKEEVPLPTKVMAIGAAEFAVHHSGTVGCIPVYSWVFPQNKKQGFDDYDLATNVLPFYISHIGPYPYLKLANVQSKTIFGGMENANTIFYDENTVRGERRTYSLLAHEIAHQWFGNSASESHFSHLWLSEGFATYMSNAYLESVFGRDSLVKLLQDQRKQVIEFSKKRFTPVVDTTTTNYMNLLNPNSYEKGGWILHMLRCRFGDKIFWKSISTYYSMYAGRNATTEDLQKVFESVTGQNLELFFRQWLYQAGQPELNIQWKYNPQKHSVEITVEQTQKNKFEFPLDIAINNGKSQVTKTINVKEIKTSVSLPTESKPVAILADPDTRLLFDGSVRELPSR